eukprot:jgi/Mesvir1/17908/Mv12974-RA.1
MPKTANSRVLPTAILKGSNAPTTRELPKNENNGYLVTEEEISSAFDFLNIGGTDSISWEMLHSTLEIFFPGIQPREAKSLVGTTGLTKDKLIKLLMNNEIQGFDPVVEAFQILDPKGTGSVDMELLYLLVSRFPGVGSLTKEDKSTLLKTADLDEDGLINLADFIALAESTTNKERREKLEKQWEIEKEWAFKETLAKQRQKGGR